MTRVLLKRGFGLDDVEWNDDDDRARRRAESLSELHDAPVTYDGHTHVVDATVWYAPPEVKKFVERVIGTMQSEHGVSWTVFREYGPHVAAAHPTEGDISDEDLEALCCGAPEIGEVPEELKLRYPLLDRIFNDPFTGELIPFDVEEE